MEATHTNETLGATNVAKVDEGMAEKIKEVKQRSGKEENTMTEQERRAIHNATERARRESLNGRLLTLAEALPAMAHVKRASKSAIVNKALDFVYESQIKEQALMAENRKLRKENERLRQLLLASTTAASRISAQNSQGSSMTSQGFASSLIGAHGLGSSSGSGINGPHMNEMADTPTFESNNPSSLLSQLPMAPLNYHNAVPAGSNGTFNNPDVSSQYSVNQNHQFNPATNHLQMMGNLLSGLQSQQQQPQNQTQAQPLHQQQQQPQMHPQSQTQPQPQNMISQNSPALGQQPAQQYSQMSQHLLMLQQQQQQQQQQQSSQDAHLSHAHNQGTRNLLTGDILNNIYPGGEQMTPTGGLLMGQRQPFRPAGQLPTNTSTTVNGHFQSDVTVQSKLDPSMWFR